MLLDNGAEGFLSDVDSRAVLAYVDVSLHQYFITLRENSSPRKYRNAWLFDTCCNLLLWVTRERKKEHKTKHAEDYHSRF